MTDADFLAALERCTLPEAEFTHAAHVRAAYLYLCDGSFGQAIDRMARRFAGTPARSASRIATTTRSWSGSSP